MIGSLVLIHFLSLQNFIAIKQEKPCLRRKYDNFQKLLSDPCLNIAEKSKLKPATSQIFLYKQVGTLSNCQKIINFRELYRPPVVKSEAV